jgi:hypothetical protein
MNNSNSDINFGNENSIQKELLQVPRTLNFDKKLAFNSEAINEVSKPKIQGPSKANKTNAM